MEIRSRHQVTVSRRLMLTRCLLGVAGLMLSAGVSNAQTVGQGYFAGGAAGSFIIFIVAAWVNAR